MTKDEALQMCLEYIETDAHERKYVRHAIKDALGQPEQEPVAWMFQHDETGRMNYVSNDGMNTPKLFLKGNPRYALVCPLYTAPPAAQRPWQGLTDEEIESAISDGFARGLDNGNISNQTVINYVRGIEAKLKELNNG